MTLPTILYEDADMLALDKPSGFVVHGDGRTDEPSIALALVAAYPEMKNVGEPWKAPDGQMIPRPGIVHRLDRDTSGVLIVAKTQPAFEYLKAQFQERKIRKTYRVFVSGIVKDDSGIITKPIGRSAGDFRKRSAEFGARGALREAVTEFRVLARGEATTLLEAYPKTGRTHQIRVHMKAIGHPVVCDGLYAPKGKAILGFRRLALHAFSVDLMSPSGRELHIEAPEPADFLAAEEMMKKVA